MDDKYFVTYGVRYFSGTGEYSMSHIVIDQHPIPWLRESESKYPELHYVIFFWSKITDEQYQQSQ